MDRRKFIAFLSGAASADPIAVRAQAMPRIGFLSSNSPAGFAFHVTAFRNGLKRGRLFRGVERHPRISLGRRSHRSAACAGRRSGRAQSRSDLRRCASGARGQSGDQDRSDCFQLCRRPVGIGPGAQPRPAGRQYHRGCLSHIGESDEEAADAAYAGAEGDCNWLYVRSR